MKRKLLLAGPIVMILMAIFIVILSSIMNKEHPPAQAQQETPKESNETFVRSVPTISSPQPKQEGEHSEPSEEEEFESPEESEEETERIQPEVSSEPENLETESSETKISPEVEALFIGTKQFIDRQRNIEIEMRPFLDESFKLNRRQIEIGMHDLVKANDLVGEAKGEEIRRLQEEFKKNGKRMDELWAMMAPFREQIRQLKDEYEHNYGMTKKEFFKKYNADYVSWKASL